MPPSAAHRGVPYRGLTSSPPRSGPNIARTAGTAASSIPASSSATPRTSTSTVQVANAQHSRSSSASSRSSAATPSLPANTSRSPPRLDGRSYAAAARAAAPPPGFTPRPRSIEGFLFPSLYKFGPATSASELVALQLAAFRREWTKVDLGPAAARGATPYDVLTIASMIERETVAPEERALVAAVIYNRLDRHMPLGIDATLRYGLGIQGTRPLTKAQLATDSPYNTRLHEGLPPTPIGNPGLPSLRAAAARRRGRLPLLRARARRRAPFLHRRRERVLPEGARVRV